MDDMEVRRDRHTIRRSQRWRNLPTKTMSESELERMTRRYATEISIIIGPDRDIPAPDVNTDGRIMAWIMDTISMHQGFTVPDIVTGKPLSLGGSLGRMDATGRGVMITASEAASRIGMALEGARVVIQGYGNAGYTAACLLVDRGCRLVAAADSTGAVYSEAGIDPDDLKKYKDANGSVADMPGPNQCLPETFWSSHAKSSSLPRWSPRSRRTMHQG